MNSSRNATSSHGAAHPITSSPSLGAVISKAKGQSASQVQAIKQFGILETIMEEDTQYFTYPGYINNCSYRLNKVGKLHYNDVRRKVSEYKWDKYLATRLENRVDTGLPIISIERFDNFEPIQIPLETGSIAEDEIPYDCRNNSCTRQLGKYLPYKYYAYRLDNRTYVVRNQAASIGFVGQDIISPEFFFKENLLTFSTKSINILPGLNSPKREYFGLNVSIVGINLPGVWLKLSTRNNNIYIQCSDFDIYTLSKSGQFSYMKYFFGLSYVCAEVDLWHIEIVPEEFDGFTFWYYLHNINVFEDTKVEYIPKHIDYYIKNDLWMTQNIKYGHIDGYLTRSTDRYYNLFEICDLEYLFKDHDIEIQSDWFPLLGQMFGTSSRPNLISSIQELGYFAAGINKTIDKTQDFMNNDLIQTIIQFVGSISNNISELVSDIRLLYTNPMLYVQKIKDHYNYNMSIFTPAPKIPAALAIGCIIAGYNLYSSSTSRKLISYGLVYIGVKNLIRPYFKESGFLARTAALSATILFVVTMEVTKLRPASIEIQADSGIMHSFAALVSLFVSCVPNMPGSKNLNSLFKHISGSCKDVFSVSRGALSLIRVIEILSSMVVSGIEHLFGRTYMYKVLVNCVVDSDTLRDYIMYSLTTSVEELSTLLTMNVDERRKWEKMCGYHNEFVALFSSKQPSDVNRTAFAMYNKAFSAFKILKEEYTKIKDSLDYFRAEPFMVWIWGKPGTGKTWSRDLFVNNMYSWHRQIDPTIPDARTSGLLYVRNPADKYMSNYTSQFAVAYDDVGQNRMTDNPEFNEIMAIGSTNQLRLNMADLTDKGRLFSSKVVIMAANTRDVEANNLIMKEEAFNRRRHVVVKVDRPKGQSTVLSTSKCDFSLVSLEVSESLSKDIIVRFPKEGYGDNTTVWREFFEWLAPHYINHVKSQKEALQEKEEELINVTTGKPSKHIVDISKHLTDGEEGHDTVDTDRTPDYLELEKLIATNSEFDAEIRRINQIVEGDPKERERILDSDLHWYLAEQIIGRTIDICEREKLIYVRKDTTPPPNLDGIKNLFDEYCQSLNEKHVSWLTLLKYASMGVGLLGTYTLVKRFFTKDEQETILQAYNNMPGANVVNNVTIQQYDNPILTNRSNNVVIQDMTKDVARKYYKALARFTCVRSEGTDIIKQTVNGVNIAYNTWILPYHFMQVDEMDVSIERDNMPPQIVKLHKNRSVRVHNNSDILVINIPELNHGKNLLPALSTREELRAKQCFSGVVFSWGHFTDSVNTIMVGEAKRWDIPIEVNYKGETLYYAQGYNYNWDSKQGDCGSLLCALDNVCNSKIMGIHFGKNHKTGKALAVLVSREAIEDVVMLVTPHVHQVVEQDINIAIQQAECPMELKDNKGKPCFEYIGLVNDAPSQPLSHKDLHRSPAWNEMYPAEKDLSVLHMLDKRMDEEFQGPPDILTRGVKDFAYVSKPWPDRELQIATSGLFGEISQFKETIPRKVQSLDWAINGTWINGTRLPHTEPLNLNTSSGYGLEGKKKKHFQQEDVLDNNGKLVRMNTTISNPTLLKMVNDQWDAWMDGQTSPTIWVHALKSEPIKLSKITSGNTRTFCVAQTAFLLNMRRLFGSFTVAMKNSMIRSFSCLGVDCFSSSWTELYNDLISTSPSGIDLDFFKYDRTAVTAQLAEKVCEAINRWYDDDLKYQRARVIAFMDLIYAYALVGKNLTRKIRGNPSGNPLTTELNNCVNYLMLVMVYLINAKKYKPEEYSITSFNRSVRPKFYGDDVIFAVALTTQDWFTGERISDTYNYFGVPVTPADKSDSGIVYKPIKELTFLKCNFLPFDHPVSRWQAGLSKSSIRSMCQFYRLLPGNGTMEEALTVNMMESLNKAYHWGRQYFNEHLDTINKWRAETSRSPLITSFDEFDIQYRAKLNN